MRVGQPIDPHRHYLSCYYIIIVPGEEHAEPSSEKPLAELHCGKAPGGGPYGTVSALETDDIFCLSLLIFFYN